VYFGTVNRMILAELVKVFLLSLIALTGMFLLAGLVQEATRKGLSPSQILIAIPLFIPSTLPFTIPATTLFATCVVYGRMSADNEVLVLRAAGVNIYHLLWPALLLGLGTTAITGGLYYDTIPRSQQMQKHLTCRGIEFRKLLRSFQQTLVLRQVFQHQVRHDSGGAKKFVRILIVRRLTIKQG